MTEDTVVLHGSDNIDWTLKAGGENTVTDFYLVKIIMATN